MENEKLIDKYKYLIMLDLPLEELKKLSKKDKMVEKYMKELIKVNEDPEFREYMSAEEDARKIENTIRSQYKREGLEEGRKESQKEMAKNFKNNGVSIEIIAKSTGLSIEEVEKL